MVLLVPLCFAIKLTLAKGDEVVERVEESTDFPLLGNLLRQHQLGVRQIIGIEVDDRLPLSALREVKVLRTARYTQR